MYDDWVQRLAPVSDRSCSKYALDKEEGSDTSKLDAEMIYLKQRIEELAANRDQGMPNTISNTRRDPIYGGGFSNDGGANGGW